MDLNRITVFVTVLESGSFTKAAAILKQPKSRVSRAIMGLEKDLGVTLLYRTTRHLNPTDAGQLLYDQSKNHIFGIQSALATLETDSQEVAGRLRVSTTPDIGTTLLGNFVAELKLIHPKLAVEIHLADQIVDLVRDRVDIAIRIGRLKDTTLKTRPLGEINFVFVASPDYLAKAPRLKTLADLANHSTLDFSRESADRQWSQRSLVTGKVESVLIKSYARSNAPKVLLDLAIAHCGVALLPEFLCLDSIKSGNLVRILKEYSGRKWPIQFVWPAQKVTNPKIRAFVDLGVKSLSKYFRPHP